MYFGFATPTESPLQIDTANASMARPTAMKNSSKNPISFSSWLFFLPLKSARNFRKKSKKNRVLPISSSDTDKSRCFIQSQDHSNMLTLSHRKCQLLPYAHSFFVISAPAFIAVLYYNRHSAFFQHFFHDLSTFFLTASKTAVLLTRVTAVFSYLTENC